MSTGSLGQGISAAVGMALAGKMDKKAYRVYTVLGDGEVELSLIHILSSRYGLMHQPGFPVLRVGSRMVVPKEKCIQWMLSLIHI